MAWQEITPGLYQRPFDTSERLYRGAGATTAHLGKQHWLVASAVQLNTLLSTSDLERTWLALRYKHPHVAAVANKPGTLIQYSVPSTEAIEAWFQSTLIIHPFNEPRSAEQLESDLESTEVWMLRYLPHSKELLFRAPHWRTDARGMILLQREYLTMLSAGSVAGDFDGTEISRLPPPFDQIAGLATEIIPEMGPASDAVLNVLFTGSTPVSVNKARGQSVTTTVHAALIMATRKHVPTSGRLMGFNPFDVRDRLPEPWNSVASCAMLGHTGKPCSIDFVQYPDFDSVAAHLSEFYSEDLQPLFGHMVDLHRKIGDILAMPFEDAISMPGAARPELSSLGVIDRYLQTGYTGPAGVFEVEDWWLGVQIMNRLLQMYLWTRDGTMLLGCNYNEAFYPAEFVDLFVDEWKEALISELEINL
ncbi:uncharacterized protein BDV14DRAFT_202596 [Aspergillus stella-maris]|uniref:uncharacterized protein n=1 Tax=Aspergillus stella-maris TaxID=1810926 RepID=UPI003CCD6D9A